MPYVRRLDRACLLAAAAVTMSCGVLSAQARDTAVQDVRLQVFAMPTYVRPDFGASSANVGATVGADANFTTRFPRVQISGEFRALGSGGDVSNQYVYSVGPRVLLDYRRFQPYADLLVGYGSIHFNNAATTVVNGLAPYTGDNSAVLTYGGGVDVVLTRTWALRADLQQQHWRLSSDAPPFYPSQFSLGLRYQFHFRNRNGPD